MLLGGRFNHIESVDCMSDPWLNQELLIIRDTQIPDQGEGPLSKASIPTEVISKVLSHPQNVNTNLLKIRASHHSSNEFLQYKTVNLRYTLALQQMQGASIAQLNKQTQSLQKDLLNSRRHAISLEQLVQNLKEKALEKQNKHSQQDYNQSLESLATLRAQLQEAQSEIETFSKQCHQEKEAKQEIEAELDAIRSQFKELKKQILDSKLQIEAAEQIKLAVDNQNSALNQKLLESTQSLDELDKEVKSIKEMLHEGIRQAKAIEKEYLEAIDEKVSATNANGLLNRNLNECQEEIRLLKEQLNDAHEREQLMQSETGHQLDQLVRQRDQFRNQYKESSETLESLRRHFGELELSHKQQSEQIKKSEIMHREQEHEIKTAHQHLAKKVKETTLLSEHMEEMKLRLSDAQKSHEVDKTRINELKGRLEQHTAEEKRLQEKIHESQKHAEEQINKWEEKYFRLAEKLQAMEARNKELQALEERHNQMQALLAGLGNFVGNSSMTSYTQQPQQRPPEHQPVYAAPRAVENNTITRPKRPDQFSEEPENLDLFKDLPQQPRTFKKDFFGE